MQCNRDSVTYAIASYADEDTKEQGISVLTQVIQAANVQFSFCDGGLWVVTGDIDMRAKPTPALEQKLKKAAQAAHQALGCKVVTLGSGGTDGSSSDGSSAAAPSTASS